MNTSQIVTEIKRLPLQERIMIMELIRKNIRLETQSKGLAAGAEALLAHYENDEELTAFTALDSEDYHETR
jgi:hypothetical protein